MKRRGIISLLILVGVLLINCNGGGGGGGSDPVATLTTDTTDNPGNTAIPIVITTPTNLDWYVTSCLETSNCNGGQGRNWVIIQFDWDEVPGAWYNFDWGYWEHTGGNLKETLTGGTTVDYYDLEIQLNCYTTIDLARVRAYDPDNRDDKSDWAYFVNYTEDWVRIQPEDVYIECGGTDYSGPVY